ncbi:MAG TPA: hypothetical protein DEB17_03165 [Chlorobaculum sp.]|uniref:Uncharacterized protein n=1 Tax=Chlorobaculum tepidum (strain ATCC 49652 / DSM 12025 / NBRC 103806 / TLS) TaxID=194439 RepID=Q8KE58_CHLTE|nr:hypothetical protein CT0832 [Chlorobaculum tepidum TLS]HBU22986.1 hypothetical protein [Chlorobaculum sp.]
MMGNFTGTALRFSRIVLRDGNDKADCSRRVHNLRSLQACRL